MADKRSNVRHMLLRLSVAVIFVGVGLWEIIQPSYWSFYVPPFFTSFINANTFTMIHGVVLLVLGAAVLLGVYLRIAAVLCALIMVTVLVDLLVYFGFTDLIIRDLSVLIAALALYFDDTDYLRLRK